MCSKLLWLSSSPQSSLEAQGTPMRVSERFNDLICSKRFCLVPFRNLQSEVQGQVWSSKRASLRHPLQ